MGGNKRHKLKKALSAVDHPSSYEDDELVDDLLAQLDASDATVQQESAEVLSEIKLNQDQEKQESGSKKDSKSRFRAREMRRAAARIAELTPEDEANTERIKVETMEEQRAIRGICDAQGLEIHEINPDGHCLFAAVADQLALLSILPANSATYHTTRHAAANYIAAHPDDFVPFLPSIDGEDGSGATDTGLMGPRDFQKYCATIRDTGAWGGEPEILAMARAFNVPIHVVQWGTPSIVVHAPDPEIVTSSHERAVRVSYHRRMYGLGEHYNSLRPKR
ncbi:cysteine proteinase [Ramaria rubella]|nr:cysteine proteinase [Ramaria rubella]